MSMSKPDSDPQQLGNIFEDRIVVYEWVGSVFWFLMDTCWRLYSWEYVARELWLWAGMVMAAPAIMFHLAALRHAGRTFVEIAASSAVVLWVATNALDMAAEMLLYPTLSIAATITSASAAGLLAAALVRSRNSTAVLNIVMRRFRRFKSPYNRPRDD